MSKILVIVGSPHESGNTAALADAFIRGAEESGNQVLKYSLARYRVNGCLGCDGCMRTGKCVQSDDMTNIIYPKLLECDTVVLATPIYCYMCTSLLKAFIERTYPMSMSNCGRKNTVLLSTAQAGGDVFRPLVQWHKANAGYIGWRTAGEVLAGGCGFGVPERYLDAAEKLGRSMK